MFEHSEFSSLQRLIAIFKGQIYMGIVSLVRFFATKEMNRPINLDLSLDIFSIYYLCLQIINTSISSYIKEDMLVFSIYALVKVCCI